MAVSVFTAGMFKPMLKLVTPAIDLKNFVTYIYEEKTCAVCGRKFRARLFVKNANPSQGVCCSTFCYGKHVARNMAHSVSEKEFKKFIEEKKHVITRAAKYLYSWQKRDINHTWKDLIQECQVAMFYLFSRCKRDKKDIYSFGDGYLFKACLFFVNLTPHERDWQNRFREEECYTESNDEFLYNTFIDQHDIEKKLDIENILKKIYQLGLENDEVRIAITNALMSVGKNRDSAKAYREEFIKKYDVCERQYYKNVKTGIEHIYYNDYKNINSYVNVYNLENNYRFNNKDEMLTEEELGKEIAHLLDYYSGYTNCSVCGKRFKIDRFILGSKRMNNYFCSDDCRRKYHNYKSMLYKRKKRLENKLQKMANNNKKTK